MITYADDIRLIATSPNHRINSQASLTLLDRQCRQLGLKLSLNKTKAMAFGGPMPDTRLITEGVEVEKVETHQYFGVWLDRNLTLQTQVNRLKSRMAFRTNVLKVITSYSSGASRRAKRAFHTHAIRSLVDYSAPCLIGAAPALVRELEST